MVPHLGFFRIPVVTASLLLFMLFFFTSRPATALRLVATDGVAAGEPLGSFTVTTIAGASVTINFAACGQLRFCATQPWPGMTTSCAARTVSMLANAAGVATFRVVGSAAGPGPSPPAGCATITADGVPIGVTTVSAFDLNGLSGVNGIDGSLWYGDFLSAIYRSRSDLDGNAAVDGLDASIWVTAYNRAPTLQPVSCAIYCP